MKRRIGTLPTPKLKYQKTNFIKNEIKTSLKKL